MVIGTRSQQEWAYEGRRAHRPSLFTEDLYVAIIDLGERKHFPQWQGAHTFINKASPMLLQTTFKKTHWITR